MNPGHKLQKKILSHSEVAAAAKEWRSQKKSVVFTNGCFDILHVGHIASLTEAARQGDVLVVGLNADASVKILKGDDRPINDEQARALVIASLEMVDAVVIFNEPTPRELIVSIMPDVLVKGGDYKVEDIAGASEVIQNGGRVFLNPIVQGFSTTTIIDKMKSGRNPQ